MTASSERVSLRGGLVVSLDALRLGWALEERGFRLEPAGDRLRVSPHAALTAEDILAIKAHRDELFRLAKYDAPTVVQ
jgi:hypothetical protein